MLLSAQLADPGGIETLDAGLPAAAAGYPALTAAVPAAFWYERAIHDLFGAGSRGPPRLDPLVLPLAPTAQSGPGRARPAGPGRR